MSCRICVTLLAVAAGAPHRCAANDALMVLEPGHPQAFFFRAAEGPPALPRTPYEAWANDFNRLMGIMGKCLDEEVLGRELRNPEFFCRFKRDYPRQAVLLHFNGNSRDPRHGTGAYFPGHWIYRNATPILTDVAAEEGETEIGVGDVTDFHLGAGRYRTSNDDIALFGTAVDGRHDWGHCEQVQLVAVDKKNNRIRVRRGCYGTRPLAFKRGAARAAAHAVEGPWGKKNNLLWFYNFATHCPRDGEGKTCADRLVDDLAAWFGKGGKLEAFDGLEFDVLFNETHGDTDGDGKPDDGVVGGVNAYGAGVIEFARQLRKRMGEDRLLLADGALGWGGRRSQRAFGIFNGIESEGFPNLDDWDFADWSGGMNRHAFWKANGRAPSLSYINHKWIEPVAGRPGETVNPEVPWGRHRLSFAAAQFTDAAICYSYAPARGADGRYGIWDELRCGADNRLGWLGRPEGPPVHMAAAQPDLLGNKAIASLIGRIKGPVAATASAEGIMVTPDSADSAQLEWTIGDVPTKGGDLVLLVTMTGEPMKGCPREMARFVRCEISGGLVDLMGDAPSLTGMALRGSAETAIAGASGAAVKSRLRTTMGDKTLPAFGVHPPYRGGTGYVFWCADADVAPTSELRFHIGMGEKAPSRSDGVSFKVLVAEISEGRPGAFEKIFEKNTNAHQWIPCSVPLARFSGKRLRIKFVADCGPADNAVTDHGYWADVKISRVGLAGDEATEPSASMTWLNDRPFTSAFYFRDVRSPVVDFRFQVDGGERVVLSKIEAHAHPDAMYRLFENGIVLANPSRSPYRFDLDHISPGRRYRRIQGTPSQDIGANSGRPVTGSMTLGERDALFLVRVL